ncbi:MAG: sigma factor-like helix-turn-helix DNA-binding protein [Acidobacteriota bacterium]
MADDRLAQLAWQGMLDAAHAQWPGVQFDSAKLAPIVAERLSADELAQAPAGDVLLAAAAIVQEPTALAAFDRVLTEVDAAGAAVGAPKDLVDEVKQLLRVQLLVPKEGKPPGIAGYRGKGPLRGWVRITATRELIRHKKKRMREAPLEQSLDHALTRSLDPALEALKAEYRSEFAIALREAIGDLGTEDRALLVQQIVHGMSIDEVGAAFGVHRATAARWLNRARAALVAATHKRLAERLKLPVEQIDSVIRLVSSQLDASVIRYLRERERQ